MWIKLAQAFLMTVMNLPHFVTKHALLKSCPLLMEAPEFRMHWLSLNLFDFTVLT